jgi:hypothetical protein
MAGASIHGGHGQCAHVGLVAESPGLVGVVVNGDCEMVDARGLVDVHDARALVDVHDILRAGRASTGVALGLLDGATRLAAVFAGVVNSDSGLAHNTVDRHIRLSVDERDLVSGHCKFFSVINLKLIR